MLEREDLGLGAREIDQPEAAVIGGYRFPPVIRPYDQEGRAFPERDPGSGASPPIPAFEGRHARFEDARVPMHPTLTADIVCRRCGAEEGVFVVLRSSCPSQKQGSCPPGSERGTTYECRTCVERSALESWMNKVLLWPVGN
jgi:hypothetical protein